MAIETQTIESENNVLDKIKWAFKWLIWNVAETVNAKKASHFVDAAIKKEKMTNTDACFLCALLDKTNLNLLTAENKELAMLIVNNWRWEWIEEMYNSGEKKKEVKNLFENLIKIS